MKNIYSNQINVYSRTISQTEFEIKKVQAELDYLTSCLKIKNHISSFDSYKENYKLLLKEENSIERIANNITLIINEIKKNERILNNLQKEKKRLKGKILGKKYLTKLDDAISRTNEKLQELYKKQDNSNILEQAHMACKMKINNMFSDISSHFNVALEDFYKILFDFNSTRTLSRKIDDLTYRIDQLSKIISISKVNIDRINDGLYPLDYSICNNCSKCSAPMFCPHGLYAKDKEADIIESISPQVIAIERSKLNFPKTKINDLQ